jgi:hypothetical protein
MQFETLCRQLADDIFFYFCGMLATTDEVLTMQQLFFINWTCNVELLEYPNGRTALQLNAEDGEPVATATVNVPHYPLGKGEVLIKDYAENEGILASLSDAGIIEPTGETVRLGFAKAHVCRLLTTETTH